MDEKRITWTDVNAVKRAGRICNAFASAVWNPTLGAKTLTPQEYAEKAGWREDVLREPAQTFSELAEKLEVIKGERHGS